MLVDTWAWVALANPDDQFHSLALRVQATLDAAHTSYATTEYIVVEAATFLRRRMGFAAAQRFLEDLSAARANGAMAWIPASERLFTSACEEFARFGRSQAISFVDATSFAAMREMGLRRVFTGDCDHFLAAGFETVPSKAELAARARK